MVVRLPRRGSRPARTTGKNLDHAGAGSAAWGGQRWVELRLLGLAGVVGAVAYLVVEFTQHQPVTMSAVRDVAAFGGLFVLAHLVIRWLAPAADPVILPCVAVLNGLGVVLIHRLDLAAADSAASRGDPPPAGDAAHQVIWTALGLVLFVVVLVVLRDHRSLARYGYTSGAAGLILLITPAVLPAQYSEVNGARTGSCCTVSPSNPVSSRRSCSSSSPPRSSSRNGTCSRPPAAACSEWTCPGPGTSPP